MQVFGASCPGKQKRVNQDALFYDSTLGVGCVVDGMGGGFEGARAAQLCVGVFKSAFQNPKLALSTSFSEMNEALYMRSLSVGVPGKIGASASAIVFNHGSAYYAHVGDCRIYLLRKGLCFLLTQDHSPVFREFQEGRLTKSEMKTHPMKNCVDRALGLSYFEAPTLGEISFKQGDWFFLCTDGLGADETLFHKVTLGDVVNPAEAILNAAMEDDPVDDLTCLAFFVDQLDV